MYERVLVPVDGSDAAATAVDVAATVASAHGATLHILNVADTNQPSLTTIDGQVRDVLESEGERIVNEAAERARGTGIDIRTAVVQGGPARTILEYVADRGIDLVVMAPRGSHRVERFFLGSVTDRVVRQADIPVMVVPPGSAPQYPPATILAGTDGSPAATGAVETAIELARTVDASLRIASVRRESILGLDVRSDAVASEREQQLEAALEAARDSAQAATVDVETALLTGTVPETLRTHATEAGADLIVVGTHGRSGLDKHLLGSVTESLLRSADVPVLSVRTHDAD